MADTARLTFNAPVAGHWNTDEGTQMANSAMQETRANLCKGHLSDFQLANAQYLASRTDLDLTLWQTAAKERIRWLSAQLAAKQAEVVHLQQVVVSRLLPGLLDADETTELVKFVKHLRGPLQGSEPEA